MYLSRQIIFYLKIYLFWIASGILFNRYGYNIGIITTTVSFILYFSLKENEKFIFILSAVPMAAIFKISSSSPSSIVLLYFIFILEYFYKHKKVNIRLLCAFILFGFCQFFTIYVFKSSITNIFSFIINIIFCEIAFKRLNNVKNKDNLFKEIGIMFSLIMCIDILLAILYPNMAFMISYEKQNALENAGRFAALNGDPNYYSQLVAVSLCFLVANFFSKKTTIIYKILFLSMSIFLVIKGLESKSKSFVVVLLFLFIILIIIFIRNSKKDNLFFLKILLISVLGILVTIIFINDILAPLFIERSMDNTSILSNRDLIWENYFHNIFNKPLVWFIGTGIMNGGNVLANGSAAHNVYIELFAETGLIGICMITYILNNVFKKFKIIFKSIKVFFIWALIITSFGLSLSSNDAMFVLLPIVALEGVKKNNEYNKKN